jgi:hypothetical protein
MKLQATVVGLTWVTLALQADAYYCATGEYRKTSRLGCSDLTSGLNVAYYTTVDTKCYFGSTSDSACPSAVTRGAAGDYCTSFGARVCTLDEVLTGNLDGLSCPITTESIWTRTPCGDDGEFWVTPADGSGTPQCVKPADGVVYQPRCCGDAVPRVCEQCPLNAYNIPPKTSGFTEYGLAECACSVGHNAAYPTTGNTREFTCAFNNEDNDYTCAVNQYAVRSAKSCANDNLYAFGYKRRRQYCAATKNAYPGVRCPNNADRFKTWAASSLYCTVRGGRLCDINEAVLGVAGNTGCNFDNQQMWTGTPCGTGKYWVTGGSFAYNRRFGEPQCLEPTSAVAVPRCCAQVTTRHCFDCPAGSTAPEGSFGADSCVCTDGVAPNGGCVTASPTPVPTVSPTPEPTCDDNQYKGKSSRTCGEIGAPLAPSSYNVCGHSRNSRGRCMPRRGQTAAQSENQCAAIGARLCTAEELQRGETRGSGCNMDNRLVWSATPCCDMTDESTCDASPASRLVLFGHGFGPARCMEESSASAGTRCCADRNVFNPCVWCPEGTGNTNSKGGLDTCRCLNSPFFGPGGPTCKQLTTAPTMSPTGSTLSCPANQYASGSKRHCVFHGWNMLPRRVSPINAAGKRTCGDTKLDGTCYTERILWAEAKNLCEAAGARLCSSAHEVNTVRATDSCRTFRRRGEGSTHFWTDRPCGQAGEVWTTNGINRIHDVCADPTVDTAFLACCADEQLPATGESTYCKKCPAEAISAPGSTDFSDCTCRDGLGFGYADHSQDSRICQFVTPAPTPAPVPTQYPSMTPTVHPTSSAPTLAPSNAPSKMPCLNQPEGVCRPALHCQWQNRRCVDV